jgi:thiamine-phosphate pyrophosphorylase
VLAAGVDIVQLRDKRLDDGSLVDEARRARELAHSAGALLIVNDRPDLAVAADADGVHLGQDDTDPVTARAALGPDRLLGLSTHTPEDILGATEADYIGVGPVHTTPTKPGRAPVGPGLVAHAAQHARKPFFAIGGLNENNIAEVLAAGATRIAVVRAIANAPDPAQAARRLRARLDGGRPQPSLEHAHGTA